MRERGVLGERVGKDEYARARTNTRIHMHINTCVCVVYIYIYIYILSCVRANSWSIFVCRNASQDDGVSIKVVPTINVCVFVSVCVRACACVYQVLQVDGGIHQGCQS